MFGFKRRGVFFFRIKKDRRKMEKWKKKISLVSRYLGSGNQDRSITQYRGKRLSLGCIFSPSHIFPPLFPSSPLPPPSSHLFPLPIRSFPPFFPPASPSSIPHFPPPFPWRVGGGEVGQKCFGLYFLVSRSGGTPWDVGD